MKPAPTIKKFSWVLIFFDWFVYCKSDLNRQRETRSTTTGRFFTARHIRFTSTSGRQGAAPILDRKKEGIASSRFPQNAGVTTTGTIYHMAASHGGPDSPRLTEVSHFRKEMLTMQAICLQSRFRVPFFGLPAGETGTKRPHDGSATI